MFEAVIFDCDGCLVETEAVSVEMELSALAGLGLTYARDDYVARFMGGTMAHWLEAVGADSQARLGAGLPRGFYDQLRADVRAAYDERLFAVEGAAAAAARLHLRKAVASSSSDDHLKHVLDLTGLWDLFAPHVYSAHAVPRGKPAPDIYLYAASKLGCDPTRCLAIEDSANGVRAAVAAGMETWGFVGGGHLSSADAERLLAAGASRVVEHWTEAEELFLAWRT